MRPAPTYPAPAGSTPLTVDELALIAERQAVIRREIRTRLLEPRYQTVKATSRREVGGSMHTRTLSFPRVAMVDEGRFLLSHWRDIKTELDIPWGVHAWESSITLLAAADFTSYFHETVKSGFAVEIAGGLWAVTPIDGFPSLANIPDEAVYHWLGAIGGVMPEDDHPPAAPLMLTYQRIAAGIGTGVVSTQLAATGGVSPYRFEKATAGLAECVITRDGMLAVAFGIGATPGERTLRVRVTDAAEMVVEGEIHIDVIEGAGE